LPTFSYGFFPGFIVHENPPLVAVSYRVCCHFCCQQTPSFLPSQATSPASTLAQFENLFAPANEEKLSPSAPIPLLLAGLATELEKKLNGGYNILESMFFLLTLLFSSEGGPENG
jgi:hypothetical protein